MIFKYSAFIENSEAVRNWLKQIGYTFCPCVTDNSEDWIFTSENGYVHSIDSETKGDILAEQKQGLSDLVDCRENIPLFKAVTAVRDDSDNMQWFVSEKGKFILCRQSELKHVIDNYYEDYSISDFHKATLEELKERFKL